jgi:hypothetical protein
MPRRRIFVDGDFFWISFTIAVMPAATSSAESLPLLVPIISMQSFGVMPSSSPFWSRQRTCWVRSPPMPKFADLSGSKCSA